MPAIDIPEALLIGETHSLQVIPFIKLLQLLPDFQRSLKDRPNLPFAESEKLR